MIRFSTNCPHLLEKEELQPKRISPDWFTKLPVSDEKGRTARVCPGMADLFKHVILVPFWCDLRLTRVREEEGLIPDPSSSDLYPEFAPKGFQMAWHPSLQAGNMPGTHGMSVLPKPLSPWYIEMDEGWSGLITPATLHGRTLPFEPIPGIIDFDVWHQSHMPCKWTREPGAEETVYAGTPFAYIFPFKREEPQDIEFKLVESGSDEHKRLHGMIGENHYRQKQKARDGSSGD